MARRDPTDGSNLRGISSGQESVKHMVVYGIPENYATSMEAISPIISDQ